MSKHNSIQKKSNPYDDYDDEDENYHSTKRINKHKSKRLDRALKIKDIDLLMDEEFDDLDDVV